MTWPVDYDAEFRRRVKILLAARDDPYIQAALLKFYSQPNHCVDWIRDFCVTYDPRINRKRKVIPFVPFQRQTDFISFIMGLYRDRENGLVEKCRDVGATWICCAVSAWMWRFLPECAIGWGSRKEEYVDDRNNPKAIFPKIRQIIDNLPKWMLPKDFSVMRNAPYMKIINPENGASITGEAGDSIGRGGRTSVFFLDEAAHVERPEGIEGSLGDNTDVRIDLSSVNGTANVFYRRRMAGELWTPSATIPKGKTRIFIFDWRDHPGKTQEWYDLRRKRAEEEGLLHVFAQEVDRDYASSVDRVIIPSSWVRACIDAHIRLAHLGDWRAGDHCAAADIADDGGDKNAGVIRKGSILFWADAWGGDPADAAHVMIPKCVEHGIQELFYDSIGVGAGFKVETNTMKKHPSWPARMKVTPWNAGAQNDELLDPDGHVIAASYDADGKYIPEDAESPINRDFYANLKAQAWFRLRTRAFKTFQAVTQGARHSPMEMLSIDGTIPIAQQLVMELSQPTHAYSANGKTLVNKKPDGARSPNLGDAAIMAFSPKRPERGFFDMD